MRTFRAAALVAILAILPMSRPVAASDDDDKKGVDGEGYVTSWLVLAPIALESEQAGADGLSKAQVDDEADLKPKDGDKIEVAGKELAWADAEAEEGTLDFNKVAGETKENSVAYAVAYLTLEDDVEDATLKVGSDDQVRVYLNGKLVHSHDEARSHEKDQDSVEGVALKKGRNVLVLKVVNEGADWLASIRFVDKEGKPLEGLAATIEPE